MLSGNVEIKRYELPLGEYKGFTYSAHSLEQLGNSIDDIWKKYNGILNIQISKPTQPGTERQNKAAHSLLAAYFASGLHSSPAKNIEQFKLWAKWSWGPCMIWDSPDGTQQRIPISWAQYSKQERCDFLDCLVSDVRQSGAYAEDRKCREIIDGMQEEK